MPTITLKKIPNAVYEKLKEAARRHHRSLNSEVLYYIERSLNTYRINVADHLRISRQLWAKTASYKLTDKQLNEAKNAGRP